METRLSELLIDPSLLALSTDTNGLIPSSKDIHPPSDSPTLKMTLKSSEDINSDTVASKVGIAMRSNDVWSMKMYIHQGLDPNTVILNTGTGQIMPLLMIAVFTCCDESDGIVSLLISRGVNVNAIYSSWSPLMWCIRLEKSCSLLCC